MYGYKVCKSDQIRSADRLMPEAQMRDSDTTGFFRIVGEVSLRIHIRMVADNLDRAFVGATVPSLPRPQNLQLLVEAGVVSSEVVTAKEVLVTSSTMPTVKLFFGSAAVRFSKTASTSDGVSSLLPRP